MKPIIGINVDIDDNTPPSASIQANYFNAILKAGGIPVIIPPMPDADVESLLPTLNGIMLIGGRDYSPSLYGQPAGDKLSPIASSREDFDLRLVRKVLKDSELPILGICAGCQIINIGLGGSLIQDIPSAVPHSVVQHTSENGWKDGSHRHQITIAPDSRLSAIYKERELSFSVPTSHHQSVKEAGANLRPTAFAEDGIIEAVEHSEKPFAIGVQWHPERDFEGNRPLFEEFLRHAARAASVPNR